MRVYISGKITGNPNYIQDFQKAEDFLLKEGYEVVNPTKAVPFNDKWCWQDYMKEDIKLLVDCDAIYMLDNWCESRGAKLELELAKNLNIKVMHVTGDLYERYVTGELPHIYISDDPVANVFNDALSIQARRLKANLKKAFPEKSEMDIQNLMFSDVG